MLFRNLIDSKSVVLNVERYTLVKIHADIT
jgi:hypothetical protein